MTSTLGPEWHLSADGINILTENGSIKEYNKILTAALNTDLKEIGSPILTNELVKEKTSKIVLQIQKIRNVSAPKANEQSQAAPRMLKLILTDGDSHIQALEVSQINSISREKTPPGTKILLNNAKINSGYILLDSKNCTVLGGRVPHLYEKWEIAKSIQRNKRRASSNEDGPPPWVNFGAKIQSGNQENDFKSLGGKSKEANKDNSEFELQRQGAIAEATSGAVRKVFGGRVKQNVQPVANNQRERQDRNKSKSKFTQKEKDVEEKPLKPSEKVSLFAFLEDKLPLNENTAKSTENHSQNYFKYEKNTSRVADNQQKPYNTPQKDFQGNPVRKDYRQENYNKNPRAPMQNSRYDQPSYNYPKQYGKANFPGNNYAKQEKPPQISNNYTKQEKPPQQTSNNYVKQEKVPQQSRLEEERPISNKTYQDTSYNAQKDKNVDDLANNVSKMSLNSQFATRSLRQHLNLTPAKKNEENFKKPQEINQNAKWNVGDECLAKYWEDGKFYNAIITAMTDRTYAVKFKGYGNIEEVLKTDCLPIVPNYNSQNFGNPSQANRRNDQAKPYSGSMEFRRSARNFK